jgi:hypothetical protein
MRLSSPLEVIMVEQKTMVRLFFFLCPDLDVEACTHLLLSQNRFQSNFSLLSVIGVWLACLLNRCLPQLTHLLETIEP